MVPLFESNVSVTNNLLNNSLKDFPPLSPTTKAFLQNLASPSHIHQTVPDDLSASDFTSGVKRIPKSKSSSASGRSHSICRALSPFPDSIQLIVKLINLCENNAIILKRWRTILQMMTCKKPGNFNLNKLRVIQLLEADLNLYLRLIWGKRMVCNCIKNKQFPPEQLGNKPGCWGTSGPLLKVLSLCHIRLLRAEASIFNNDATQCHDRVLASIAQLCCQRLGLTLAAAKFLLELLRITKHYIKTTHGISADFNSDILYPPFGILQGSGAGPALWLSVSIVLIAAYKQKFKECGIPDASDTSFLSKLLDAFVDDADSWDVLTSANNDPNTVALRLQKRAQFWEKILFTSGGKLNCTKCYYLIKWLWDADGNPHPCSPADCPASLSLTNGNDPNPVTITRMEPTMLLKH